MCNTSYVYWTSCWLSIASVAACIVVKRCAFNYAVQYYGGAHNYYRFVVGTAHANLFCLTRWLRSNANLHWAYPLRCISQCLVLGGASLLSVRSSFRCWNYVCTTPPYQSACCCYLVSNLLLPSSGVAVANACTSVLYIYVLTKCCVRNWLEMSAIKFISCYLLHI